jgi:glutamate-1-semialdehyde 2,1-aminomutase
MDYIAPDGPVYQAGTLSGNPVAMAAGLTTLNLISQPGFFDELSDKTIMLTSGLQKAAESANVPFTTNAAGGMFGLFFSSEKSITTFEQVMSCDKGRFNQFFHGMLDRGIYLAPSAFEAGFVSSAHTLLDIEQTVKHASDIMKKL